ncbi:MAG TPA: class I SAM-dependent methyltransferase [Terriglobales bacterium]|nr:class I SAM-dependent methyltransferase [Terriglobales bacterium]
MHTNATDESGSTAPTTPATAPVDCYTHDYEMVLDRALAAAGENSKYFARTRVEWLQIKLKTLRLSRPGSILDFGCGTGGAIPFLAEMLSPERLLGVDGSAEAIRRARLKCRKNGVEFAQRHQYQGHSEFDLAFCNGVFHHIDPGQRQGALSYVYESLRPGGILAFWENNPWNPGTRYIMRRCEFDRDAQLLSIGKAKRLLGLANFEILDCSTCFYFPRWLKRLRVLEPALSRLPLGGQYLVLARRDG